MLHCLKDRFWESLAKIKDLHLFRITSRMLAAISVTTSACSFYVRKRNSRAAEKTEKKKWTRCGRVKIMTGRGVTETTDKKQENWHKTLPFLATSISSSVQREVSPASPAPAKSKRDTAPSALTERNPDGDRKRGWQSSDVVFFS